MKYDPFEETYDVNIKKFVAGLVQNDIETIKLFTFDTNYLPTNMNIHIFGTGIKVPNSKFINHGYFLTVICLFKILCIENSLSVTNGKYGTK